MIFLKLIISIVLSLLFVTPSYADRVQMVYVYPGNEVKLRYEGTHYGSYFIITKRFEWKKFRWHPDELATVSKKDYKELYDWMQEHVPALLRD